MGIFDWLFGKKKSKPQKKVVKKTKKKVVKKPKKKVHWDDTEDIGIVTHYKGKPFTGICFYKHENGQIIEECEMKNGLRDGLLVQYYPNGKKKHKVRYKLDKEVNGEIIWYHENGQTETLESVVPVEFNDLEKYRKFKKLIDRYGEEGLLKMVDEYSTDDQENNNNSEKSTKEKYKKIQGYLNIHFVDDLSEILELDFDNNDIELFFGFKSVYEGSCYQCIKHETNTKSEKISTFNEGEHIRDVSEFDVEEEFDETCEVFDGRSYSVWLKKIKSREFIVNFMKKIRDYCSKNDGDISDFLLENNCEVMGSDDLEEIYIKLGGNPEDYETIFDDMDIDDKGNLINWFSYNQIEEEYFQIGYRIN